MGPQIQHNDKELWQHKRQAYEGDSLPYCNMKTSPTKTSGSWWIRVEIDIRNQGRCMEKAHKNLDKQQHFQNAWAVPNSILAMSQSFCRHAGMGEALTGMLGDQDDPNPQKPNQPSNTPHSQGLLRGFLHLPISSD